MAKSKTAAPAKKKGSKAITVFNIIFIVLLIIGVLAAIGSVVVALVPSLKAAVKNQAWCVSAFNYLKNWVKYHLCNNLSIKLPFRGHGYGISVMFYLLLWLLFIYCLAFLAYTPFLVMNKNRKRGKTAKFRKVLCWINFIVCFLVFIGYLSIPYTQKITDLVGKAYTWFPNAYATWRSFFEADGILHFLRMPLFTTNTWVVSTIYIIIMLVIFSAVFNIVALKAHSKVEARQALAEKKAKEAQALAAAKEQEREVNEIPTAVPVGGAAAVVTPDKERIVPTIRELALLNSLEPIEFSPVVNLPGLYDTDVEKLIDLLEPQINEELSSIELNCKDAIEAKKISEAVEPKIKTVTSLPGIDEWNANPWNEEEINEPAPLTEIYSAFEEKEEEPEVVEQPPVEQVEEKECVEEDITETIIEPEPEVVVDETPVEVQTEEEVVEEKVEETPVEEVKEPEPEASEETPIEEVKTEEVVEEKVEETPVEEVKEPEPEVQPEPVEEKVTSREEYKETMCDNTHEEVVTEKFNKENNWVVPEIVEEEVKVEPEPVVEEKKEEKPVEQKPVEQKPVSNVKQVELKKVTPVQEHPNKPKIVPIAPVVKEEEAPIVEEKKEEKTLSPISGPLHSTEKSKHEKIEAVKAQKVKFELQNYRIKTYEGDLTAEEAFAKGVTKVQPTVNPVFANQSSQPEWKQKRRNEEVKKNGYVNVTKVDKLDGSNKSSASTISTSATSIRDMVKAQKNAEEAPVVEEKKEENKIAKPTAPIAVNAKPVEEKKEDTKSENANPFSEKPVPAFHPIAPIAKKDNKRPVIKPVDPMKKK